MIKNTTGDLPALWGIEIEVSYWSHNTQPVFVNNPMFDPNFVENIQDKPVLWGIQLENTYWSHNSQPVVMNNPMFDPNFVETIQDKPILWGIQLENTYWSNNTQPVVMSNPMFNPNFMETIQDKPVLWGIQCEPILSEYTQEQEGTPSTSSYENIASGSEVKTRSQPLIFTSTSLYSVSSNNFTTVATFTSFIEGTKDVFSFSGKFKMAAVGTTGGSVRVVINGLPVWTLTSNIIDINYVDIYSGIIPIPDVVKRYNASWIIEVQMKGTGLVAIQTNSFSVILG